MGIKERPYYWIEQDTQDATRASTFTELFIVAKRVLCRMHESKSSFINVVCPIIMISGPISTGGLGSVDKNLEKLSASIMEWEDRSTHERVFNQLAFQEHVRRIKHSPLYKGNNKKLLEEFFLPLFRLGYIKGIYFLPDWESSEGCRYEHQYAKELGIRIVYIGRVRTFDEFQKWVDEDWDKRSGGVPAFQDIIAKFKEEAGEFIKAVEFRRVGVLPGENKDADPELEAGQVVIQLNTALSLYKLSLENGINKAKRNIEKRHAENLPSSSSMYISLSDWDEVGPKICDALIEFEQAKKKKSKK